MQKCTLALGCFWKPEENFKNKHGILETEVGYAGGKSKQTTYEEVCTGSTGHAEVVRLTFDENIISFKKILNLFFKMHDPTQKDMQFPDVGTQYRSVIFYHNENQKQIALETIKYLDEQKFFSNKIVTEVMKIENFYIAEDYHQSFYQNNPYQPYCQFIINPKMEKLKQNYSHLISTEKTGTLHDF